MLIIKLNFMKTIGIFLLWLLFLGASCNNNDDDGSTNPSDQLPPATEVGAQTFGCLVDGEVFLPKTIGQNRLTAFNQLINGKYNLVISSSNSEETDINIQGSKLDAIVEGEYPLGSEGEGKFNVVHIMGINNDTKILSTSDSRPGILVITNHDHEKFILSGTFSYVVQHNGQDIIVTQGRFDVKYTN